MPPPVQPEIIWRALNVPGNPLSGPYQPPKGDIVALLRWVLDALEALGSATGIDPSAIRELRDRLDALEDEVGGLITKNGEQDQRLTDLVLSVAAEVDRAQTAEAGIAGAIAQESTRAKDIEQGLRTDLGAEVTRATGIEQGLRTDLGKETTRALAGEQIARTLAAPKFTSALDPFTILAGGAQFFDGSTSSGATVSSGGLRIPAGQNGRTAQLRARFNLTAAEVTPRAGRPIRFVGTFRTSGNVLSKLVDGAGNPQLSFSLEGSPNTATVRGYETQADILTVEADVFLAGSERTLSVILFVGGGSVTQTADLTLKLIASEWFPLDPAGTSDVLDTKLVPFLSSVGELVATAVPRRQLDGGAVSAYADRGIRVDPGKTGAGTLLVAGLPLAGLVVGTVIRARFRFLTSADLEPNTALYTFGSTVDYTDGSQAGTGASALTKVTTGVYEATVLYTVLGGEVRLDYYLGISGASVARSTPAFVVLKQVGMDIVSTVTPTTINAQIQRVMEAYRTLLAHKPDTRDFVTVSPDFTADFARIREGTAAMRSAANADECNNVYPGPGTYTGECSPGVFIDPQENVNIIGTGGMRDVRIVARFPSNQANQGEIQPIFSKWSGRIANMSLLVENVRYGEHIESGNSRNRAIQIRENMEIIHLGSTGWPSPSAWGVGQHEGNEITWRNCRGVSPTCAIGVHNNINWTRPASVTIEDSYLLATNADGQAISAVSCGAGVMSPFTVRNTTLNGMVAHICTFLNGSDISVHKANRYEYTMTFDGCTPFDWTSSCDVSALALTSIATAGSSVGVTGAGATVLFGAMPDTRMGAADYAGRIYSYHAVDVISGEADPGVTLAARLGDRRSAPLTLNVAFDGAAPVAMYLDADYRGMSNADIVASLNTKLAAAMGGSTGGRAFSLAKPYVNRAPIFQPDREGFAVNADTATILKGHILVWSGRSVRLMTTTDTLDLFAGIALGDAIPGDRVRFQKTGYIGQPHLLFSGSPTFAIGDLFGVGGTVGRIAKSAAHAVLRVRSLAGYGAVFEILENRFDSGVIEISPANVADFSVSGDWADYGSADFVATGRILFATAFVALIHQNATAQQLSTRLRLVDRSTGSDVDVVLGQPAGTLGENGRQINNAAGLTWGRMVPGRSYSLRLQHFRAGTNGPTQITNQRILAICVP